jgi:diacylglycerol kinase (ATP)
LRVLLTYNPTAGDEGADVRELVSLLEAAGHTVEDAHSVKERGWKSALDKHAELVVVAGGDGTVSKVFRHLAGGRALTTLLPLGSANNIARSLGYGDDALEALVRDLPNAKRRWFDVGTFAFTGSSASFVESAGGGVFAEMLVRAENVDGDRGGEAKLELGLRLLRRVVEDASALEWVVRADGVDLSGEFLAVEVMNIREIGPNLPLAPRADPGDGVLELTLVRPDDRSALAGHIEARLAGRPAVRLELDSRRAKVVVLRPPPGCRVHVDDDLMEGEPDAQSFTAEVTSRVAVLVP